ncbi:MAG: hypothetical protein F6K55_07790 [Moorea sp. SIO4A3]|nr:hypothetical protein [Moorena sp. SIO4A3]
MGRWGMGILVELASWWNWHLGRTGILPVSCLFSGGEDAHSTGAISHEVQRDPPLVPLNKGDFEVYKFSS